VIYAYDYMTVSMVAGRWLVPGPLSSDNSFPFAILSILNVLSATQLLYRQRLQASSTVWGHTRCQMLNDVARQTERERERQTNSQTSGIAGDWLSASAPQTYLYTHTCRAIPYTANRVNHFAQVVWP